MRERAADRAAGTDEPVVRPRQDLRAQAVPGLSPSIRGRFHLRPVDEPLGPGDEFDLQAGHVVPALLRKTHEAAQRGEPTVTVWGTGRPRREFLHVDDCADALMHLMSRYSGEEHINVGTGRDVTIRELAELIGRIVGYGGRFVFDPSRPDGSPQKRLDVTRLDALGWRATIDLETGLRQTYDWYVGDTNVARISRSMTSGSNGAPTAWPRLLGSATPL